MWKNSSFQQIEKQFDPSYESSFEKKVILHFNYFLIKTWFYLVETMN